MWIDLGRDNIIDKAAKSKIDHDPLRNLNQKLMMFDPNRPKDLRKIKKLIQAEIDILNEELKILQNNYVSKKDIFDEKASKKTGYHSIKNEKNNTANIDILGNEFLSLVKTIKCLIKSNLNEAESKKNESKAKTCNCLFFFYKLSNFKCNKMEKCSNFPIKKIYDTNCKRNMHYVNTLENLKLNIVRPKKKVNLEQVSVSKFEQDIMTKRGYKYLDYLRCYKKQIHGFTKFNIDVDKTKTNELNTSDFSNDWKYLAIVIDRVIFTFFSLIIPVCLLLMYFKFYLKETVDLD